MARAKVQVSATELQAEIDLAEKKNKGAYKNLSKLFDAVASNKWAKSNGITAAVIALRYKEFSLTSKTVPGKRGRPPGVKPTATEPAPLTTEPTITSEQKTQTAPSVATPTNPNGTIKKYNLDGKLISWVELIYRAHVEGFGIHGQSLLRTSDAARFLRLREHTVTDPSL
jgi:hypothetical protein